MGRPPITFKRCELCGVTSESNPAMFWHTSKMCRQCYRDRRREEQGMKSPVKRRVRTIKPSICKHCARVPSDDLKFKSRYVCTDCQYKRFTPEELEAYREHWRKHRLEYEKKKTKAFQMYKKGLLKPVESSVETGGEQCSASSVSDLSKVEK